MLFHVQILVRCGHESVILPHGDRPAKVIVWLRIIHFENGLFRPITMTVMLEHMGLTRITIIIMMRSNQGIITLY